MYIQPVLYKNTGDTFIYHILEKFNKIVKFLSLQKMFKSV